MELRAAAFYQRYQPSACALRPRLYHSLGEPAEAELDAFQLLLRRMGKRWETEHLAELERALGPAVRIAEEGDYRERRERTLAAVRDGAALVYQPVLFGHYAGDFINGIPDLLVRTGDGYAVRDVKLARRLGGHRDITLQVGLYSWLFNQEFGTSPVALEVALGTHEVVSLDDDGGAAAICELETIRQSVEAAEPAYEPVGWSKCGGCAYKDPCWAQAKAQTDVSLLPRVDQGLARALHQLGVGTPQALLARFDEETLRTFKRTWGEREQAVGKAAVSIMRHARAAQEGRTLHIARFPLSLDEPYVMFDLEGVPPEADELEKIYLWGMQVFGPGVRQEPFSPAVAPYGDGGDEAGWGDFLAKAGALMEAHPGIRFVHWAVYEKTAINRYIERYGDPDGVAGRVLASLCDLLPLTQEAVVLPAPSYSLKVVERLAGFERTQDEYGGQWSIAKYIEAVETGDAASYDALLEQVLTYNREDLEATWAVLTWLARNFGGEPTDA
ncbi:MAG: TM0106 family RecB-like putative nuclease [Chloroflexota bacterium]